MRIIIDDLNGPEIASLLQEHRASMSTMSPPESTHALDIEGLRQPDVIVWSLWDGEELAGCGALKELDARHAEIKSMRTASAYLRQGVASELLRHMIEEARRRDYRRLSLETGCQEDFEPARRLYAKFGFRYCGPFGSYVEDPNSVFMTREL